MVSLAVYVASGHVTGGGMENNFVDALNTPFEDLRIKAHVRQLKRKERRNAKQRVKQLLRDPEGEHSPSLIERLNKIAGPFDEVRWKLVERWLETQLGRKWEEVQQALFRKLNAARSRRGRKAYNRAIELYGDWQARLGFSRFHVDSFGYFVKYGVNSPHEMSYDEAVAWLSGRRILHEYGYCRLSRWLYQDSRSSYPIKGFRPGRVLSEDERNIFCDLISGDLHSRLVKDGLIVLILFNKVI